MNSCGGLCSGRVLLGELLVAQIPEPNDVMPSAVHIRLGVATWAGSFFGKYNDPLARLNFNLKHLAATLADQFPISTVHRADRKMTGFNVRRKSIPQSSIRDSLARSP
jgi:hypothetical protein